MSKSHSTSVGVKLVLIGVLVAVLMVPLLLVRVVISEREGRLKEAVNEIGSTWGGAQTVAAPVLVVPWRERVIENGKVNVHQRWFAALPEKVEITGEVVPEVRKRGLFEVVVYRAKLRVSGQFRPPAGLAGVWDEARFGEAHLAFGVSDLRGLGGRPKLELAEETLDVDAAGVVEPLTGLLGQPLAAKLPDAESMLADASATLPFSLELDVGGSGQLRFVPLGADTAATIESPWPDPSFQGAFLPAERTVSKDGFDAAWRVSGFARAYPQEIRDLVSRQDLTYAVSQSAFGVDLMPELSAYRIVERCTKYGLLFVLLTFTAFFLFELLGGLRVHPMQYLMVGFALVLFFLLLLAFAEHVGFLAAYGVATLATVGLIGVYGAAVLKTRQRTMLLVGELVALYGILYVLVQLETFALLVGAVVLFFALGGVMWLTREVDWYSVGKQPAQEVAGAV